jgi:hypothetical protein
MGNIGTIELLFLLTAGLSFVTLFALSIAKLIKSKLSPKKKIGWTIAILINPFLGLVVFLIYHDFYLSPELRAKYELN